MASDFICKYQDFVKQNIDVIGEVETALKWLSYFVAGRSELKATGTSSSVLSELVYSASNVLGLVNDTIIRRYDNDDDQNVENDTAAQQGQFFRVTLTLIDYLEVFAEISSNKLWGTKGKWLIVAVIQICKSALRLFLMWKHRCGILTSPPVLPMSQQQRKTVFRRLEEKRCAESQVISQPEVVEESPKKAAKSGCSEQKLTMSFTLKRSGRIVRSLSSAPPVIGRTWKLPVPLLTSGAASSAATGECLSTELNQIQLFGELLHAVRPLMLLLMRLSLGQQSWTQWLLVFGMDVTSLRLLGNRRQYNAREIEELRYRSITLLHYVLRSPFYDKFTKERLVKILDGMSRRIPLARFICNPIIDFLPAWQNTYFYSWDS